MSLVRDILGELLNVHTCSCIQMYSCIAIEMDADSMEYWSKFLHMTELMRSLQLLHFFVEYPVVQVVMKWVSVHFEP